MENKKHKSLVPKEVIMSKILVFRNQKVIIFRDLAELYEVKTKT